MKQPGIHLPVVYDRQFYRDIFAQYAEMLRKGRAMKTLVPYAPESGGEGEVDPRRQKQQVCHNYYTHTYTHRITCIP